MQFDEKFDDFDFRVLEVFGLLPGQRLPLVLKTLAPNEGGMGTIEILVGKRFFWKKKNLYICFCGKKTQ